MKFIIKKILILIFVLFIFLPGLNAQAKDSKAHYTRDNISNYFSGIILSGKNKDKMAFNHLKKVQSISDKHFQFNVEFLRTLVLLEKFGEAFKFSKNIWSEKELFFEADLLLGLDYFLKKDFLKAEKHFHRLNKISQYNLYFDNFIGNVLISWIKAAEGKKEESYKILKKIPDPYNRLQAIQEIFLQCYFDERGTKKSFENLIDSEEYNFSRYNFFLVNYLLSKNLNHEAKKIVDQSIEKYESNLLLKQTENFFLKNQTKKIKNFFNCKNPTDSISEFFYLIANLYSSEKEYQLSNFYLKISIFLNKNFFPNNALLAENYYYQDRQEDSKKVYNSLKSIGEVYSWYASKNISTILLDEKGKEFAIKNLEKDFKLLKKREVEHYYELANFYKENEYYQKSIEYYSLTIQKIKKSDSLYSKILDRRGTSFERLGNWEKAEKDLMESLKILPDQPHVLNYLAYSWVDKGINLDKSLEMLKKATDLKKNDGYIIDSLGWAYYNKKNYTEAEFFLQKAVELLPQDPIINDHYADTLWMLNKNIQARYFWDYILKLEDANQNLKEKIKKK